MTKAVKTSTAGDATQLNQRITTVERDVAHLSERIDNLDATVRTSFVDMRQTIEQMGRVVNKEIRSLVQRSQVSWSLVVSALLALATYSGIVGVLISQHVQGEVRPLRVTQEHQTRQLVQLALDASEHRAADGHPVVVASLESLERQVVQADDRLQGQWASVAARLDRDLQRVATEVGERVAQLDDLIRRELMLRDRIWGAAVYDEDGKQREWGPAVPPSSMP